MGGIETIQVKMVGLVIASTTLFDSMEFNHHHSTYCLKCQLDLNGTWPSIQYNQQKMHRDEVKWGNEVLSVNPLVDSWDGLLLLGQPFCCS
jgi:hypothetical protein